MGLGDFLFGAACFLADQRPSQKRRRRAQKDMYEREQSWNPFVSRSSGTCFACDGKGYKDWDCRACNGTGTHTYPPKKCNACEGTGQHTYPRKDCFKCNGTGINNGSLCVKCNGTGEFKPSATVDCKKCKGTGVFSPERTVTCKKCDGTGEYHPKCKKCGGTGLHTFK